MIRTGQRVIDVWGNKCSVVSIDKAANGGLGSISARYDDGHVATWALAAHPLQPVWLGTLRNLWRKPKKLQIEVRAGVYFSDTLVCIHGIRVWRNGPVYVRSEPYTLLQISQMEEVARCVAEIVQLPVSDVSDSEWNDEQLRKKNNLAFFKVIGERSEKAIYTHFRNVSIRISAAGELLLQPMRRVDTGGYEPLEDSIPVSNWQNEQVLIESLKKSFDLSE